jgi:hypothetical protein
MAFEAFVASGAARRDRARRVGVAVSLALHLPPLVLFALQLVVRPTLTERTESVSAAGANPVVPLRIAGLWVPPPVAAVAAPRVSEPAAPPATAAAKAAPRPKQTAPARAAQRALARAEQPEATASPKLRLPAGGDTIVTQAERHAVLAAVHTPPASEIEMERRAAAVGTEILAGLTADSGGPAALSLSAGPPGDSGPRSAPGHELTSGAAAYLRTYETFPTLPDSSWSWGKRTYAFMMKVCVAESGHVDEVVIQRGSRPDLDAHLAAAIRTWRYRPWIVSGSARPFCHPLRITYSRG